MTTTRIQGAFTGFNGDAIFRLANGQVWQQAQYRYRYHYAYRPEVRIVGGGSRAILEVPCMDDSIEVVRATIDCDGMIVNDFSGYDGDTVFEFNNGQIWKQDEYKYSYHYAHRPHACIISGRNGTTIHVDGMSDAVRVRRIR